MNDRLTLVEQRLGSLADELRTQRLVVVDNCGRERIIATVDGDVAEVTVSDGGELGRRCAVTLCSSPGRDGLPPQLGIQIWCHGDTIVELVAHQEDDGSWQADVAGLFPSS